MDTLIDLRTPIQDRLIARFEPGTLRLHVRHRGESCVFDLPEIVRVSCADALVLVRSEETQESTDGG